MSRTQAFAVKAVETLHSVYSRIPGRVCWSVGCLLLLLLCNGFLRPAVLSADEALITPEIRYRMPEAGEVFLVGGVNGWNTVPEETRPVGIVVKDDVMHTPMIRQGHVFVAKVGVPARDRIDYGFLITKKSNSTPIEAIWEQAQDYQIDDSQDGITAVRSRLTLANSRAVARSEEVLLVTQEIRYHMPEAGEVFLVWGIDGWTVASDEARPAGTVLRDNVMHTPMVSVGDAFVAWVRVPDGATIDYGFLITKMRSGKIIAAVWDRDAEGHVRAPQEGPVQVQASITLEGARRRPSVVDVALHPLAIVLVILGIWLALGRVAKGERHRTLKILLLLLTLVGLAVRLWAAWDLNQSTPDAPSRLVGDESAYDSLATALLEGSFFQWPGRTPVYPLFLAASYAVLGHSYARLIYVQAFLGAAVIPLTYLLARRFIGTRESFLAAALIALHPVLTLHVTRVYSEILFTPLLLLTVLALLWALETPRTSRFLVAGGLLGVTTLTRPTTALLPVILPVILPRQWSLRRRAILTLAFVGSMAAVIAPWTYHNYRTHDTFLPLGISWFTTWEASPEYYHLTEAGMTWHQIYAGYLDPAANGGHDPFTIEGSRYFTARALASIRAEPLIYAWYSVQKLVYFWLGHPAKQWEWPFNFHWMFNYLPAWKIAGVYWSRLLPMFALTSVLILRRRLRDFAVPLAICGYFMLVHSLLVSGVRYSEPLHPILAVLIAAAVGEAAARHRVGHRPLTLLAQNLRGFVTGRLRPSRCHQGATYLRDLLWELVSRDLKLRYKRSVLGVAWSLLNPLFQMLVLIFIFGQVLQLGIPNYPAFVFLGVIAYEWFQASLYQATGAIMDNRELVKRPGFPVSILPVVAVTVNLIHFLLALPILVLFIVLGGGRISGAIVALPLLIVLQFLLLLALGYLVATLQVSFRDTQHILGVLLRLLYFLTPVFYTADLIPMPYQRLYQLNPMAYLITAYRTILLEGALPSLRSMLVWGIIFAGLLYLGYRVFARASHRFEEEL